MQPKQSEQELLNIEHTIRPQPGDLWLDSDDNECVLITWSDGEHIEFLRRDTSIGSPEHRWNVFGRAHRVSIEELTRWVVRQHRHVTLDGYPKLVKLAREERKKIKTPP